MKFFKNIVICLSIISVLTIFLVSHPVKVYATVPSSQLVNKNDGAWGGYAFDYSLQGKYFTIQDATGIPTSTYLNAQYFYTSDNITFYALSGKDLYTAILNRGIGLIVSSSYLNLLYNSFMSTVGAVTDTTNGRYLQGALYDSNNVFLGYCVNDISGCYYNQPLPADTPAVDVPSELTNDVYNHYQYYTADKYPDYLTIYPPSYEFIKSKTFRYWTMNDNAQTIYNEQLQLSFNDITSSNNLSSFQYYINSNNQKIFYLTTYQFNADHYIYYSPNVNDHSSPTEWNNLCEALNLDHNSNELLFSDFFDSDLSDNNFIYYKAYDSSNNLISNNITYYHYNYINQQFLLDNTGSSGVDLRLGKPFLKSGGSNIGYGYEIMAGNSFTIYKNNNIYSNIINQSYNQESFNSESYNNYDSNNDNSFNTTYNNIDNSINNNSTIYNELTDNYYDYVQNSTVNTQEITNNTTNIINNYYGDNSGGSGEGGEGGGGSDNPSDDDINDDNILSALLTAIRHFFHTIGVLLGTILTGIVDILDSILTAIAGVMENLTGVTDFISALFGWIPSPVPEVLGLAISITILFALIKFIRG